MRLSDKINRMARNGLLYNNPYDIVERAVNIPISLGTGYASGLQIGQGLGFDEQSQKNLGLMSMINNGLNSSASLIQAFRSNSEARLMAERAEDDEYQRVPQQRYNYQDYMNDPFQNSYFKHGGKTQSELGYSNGSPFIDQPFLDIDSPQGLIDMSDTAIPLYAVDDTGYDKVLEPYSGMHQFPGTKIREHKFQNGGSYTEEIENTEPASLIQEEHQIEQASTNFEVTPQIIEDLDTFDIASFEPEIVAPPIMETDTLEYKTPKLAQSQVAQGQAIRDGLLKRGFSREETSAVLGNLFAESGFNPEAEAPSTKAYGLMQWLGERKEKLQTLANERGVEISDLDLQLDHIANELKGQNRYETSQFNKAMKGNTIAEKARLFGKLVERPSDRELNESLSKRVNIARFFDKL